METNKKKQYIYSLFILIVVIVVLIMATRQSENRLYRTSNGVVWTTTYHITYESSKVLDDSIQNIFAIVDGSASMFNENSLIARINTEEKLSVDSVISCLYVASKQVNIETEGAFDPTVSPLMRAWGFVKHGGTVPDSTVIDSIKQFVGIHKTSLVDGCLIKEDKRTAFDFSAIAKGFACDEIGRMFSRNGVNNYLVEIGGEIALQGVNPNGDAWVVSVDAPIESLSGVVHENMIKVCLTEGGIATSGNYRNFKDVEGLKVVHTMNPLTGYPEISNLLSATIIAKNCMYADAYATACMVMGLERSRNFLTEHEDIAGLLIYADGDSLVMWKNPRFETILSKN